MTLDSSLTYYIIGLFMIAAGILLTRRRWRWMWLVGLLGLCWLSAVPHGM